MTNEQSNEILSHIILELNRNGFSYVVEEINSRRIEDFDLSDSNMNFENSLIYFLDNTIEILENNSNPGVEKIIQKINKNLSGEDYVEEIFVKLIDKESSSNVNLKELPNYYEIIERMRQTRNEIINDI